MTRIRYESTSDPNVVKSKRFTVGDKTLYVLLNKHAMSFHIYDANNDQLVKSGGGTKSYVNLLRLTRKALEELGVSVVKEVRREYSKRNVVE